MYVPCHVWLLLFVSHFLPTRVDSSTSLCMSNKCLVMSQEFAKIRRELQTVLNPRASFIVELMLSNLVCMSAISRMMSALLVVWKSSSTSYELRCEFSGHKKRMIKWIRHATSFKDFCVALISTNLVVFCSTFFQHSNAWWLSCFIFI